MPLRRAVSTEAAGGALTLAQAQPDIAAFLGHDVLVVAGRPVTFADDAGSPLRASAASGTDRGLFAVANAGCARGREQAPG